MSETDCVNISTPSNLTPNDGFYRALAEYNKQLEIRNDDMGLFMSVTHMAHYLIEKMHERYPEIKSEWTAPTMSYISEVANKDSGINTECWRKFIKIRNTLVHTNESRISINVLVTEVVPEFIKEYERLN